MPISYLILLVSKLFCSLRQKRQWYILGNRNVSRWNGAYTQSTKADVCNPKFAEYWSNQHLTVDRIDLCSFANSQPFRVRIVNRLSDNFDYFYIKRADASRVYGLELNTYFLQTTSVICRWTNLNWRTHRRYTRWSICTRLFFFWFG